MQGFSEARGTQAFNQGRLLVEPPRQTRSTQVPQYRKVGAQPSPTCGLLELTLAVQNHAGLRCHGSYVIRHDCTHGIDG